MEFCHKQSSANPGSNEPGHGSGNLKNQRYGLADDDNWKIPKMQRPNEVDFCSKKNASENFAGFERSNLWESGVEDGQKMLSFCSNTEQARYNGGMNDGRSIAFSIYQDENHRGNGGGFNEVMRGPFARLKGPFTPSQWMELEVQALIYKHFVANVPVPSNLLLPIKRSLYSYGSSPSYYASNFLGWGPFHLGFSGSNDPEPGRCRRTDGKKWRCSRDAVPDQKYCERHINRGRHRSRKPVESQTGQAISGSTNTKKVEPIAPSTSASVMSSGSASNSLGAVQQQYNSLQQQQPQPNTVNAFTDHLINRTQGYQGLALTPKIDPKSKDIPFSVQKEHLPFEESSHSMFGLVTSDSLVNPYMNTTNPGSLSGFNGKEPNDQHPVHHFMDDFPKDQPTRTSWPEELKSDWTQLSMSIPMAQDHDQEKPTIPTLSLSNELDPGMSLGVNRNFGEPITKQSWLPVTWGSSMGGPLGEVLSSTGSTPQVRSSPTCVLQKSTFVTLSNSSSGSSPVRDDNEKVTEDAKLCYGLGSALVSSKAVPSL